MSARLSPESIEALRAASRTAKRQFERHRTQQANQQVNHKHMAEALNQHAIFTNIDADLRAMSNLPNDATERQAAAAYLLDRADQTTECCWVQLTARARDIAQGAHVAALEHGELDADLLARVDRIGGAS